MIHFTPAPGRGGVREIVAQIQVDGVAAPDRTVGHYRAGATVKTGKPRSLVVKRRGAALRISWRPVAGAIGYAIVVKPHSAAERVVKVSPRRHTVRLSGIAKTQRGTVSVSARGALLDWGRPSIGGFHATQTPLTVLRPFRLLGEPLRSGSSRQAPGHHSASIRGLRARMAPALVIDPWRRSVPRHVTGAAGRCTWPACLPLPGFPPTLPRVSQ